MAAPHCRAPETRGKKADVEKKSYSGGDSEFEYPKDKRSNTVRTIVGERNPKREIPRILLGGKHVRKNDSKYKHRRKNQYQMAKR